MTNGRAGLPRLSRYAAVALVLGALAQGSDGFSPDTAGEWADFAGLTRHPQLMADRWIKIERSKGGHYWTFAQINDAKVAVLIDTGASGIALSYEDAERAGLHPFRLKFDKKVYTANGPVWVAEVNLRQVVIETIIVRDVRGFVMPKGRMRGTLLGMSFLNRLTSFSFERGVLVLEE